MATKQINTRLPKLSQDQLDKLVAKTGMTKTQLLIKAIDDLYYKYDAHLQK